MPLLDDRAAVTPTRRPFVGLRTWMRQVAWLVWVLGASSGPGVGTWAAAQGPEPAARWTFSSSPDNDLYAALCAAGLHCARYATPAEAVSAAVPGTGVLILADGYPAHRTEVASVVLDEARRKRLRLYVEYPASLAGIEFGEAQDAKLERGVVTSDFFGESLPAMRIVMLHRCRFVPARVERAHLVLARVAGVDTAVYGLSDTARYPVLFEHPGGGVGGYHVAEPVRHCPVYAGRSLASDLAWDFGLVGRWWAVAGLEVHAHGSADLPTRLPPAARRRKPSLSAFG